MGDKIFEFIYPHDNNLLIKFEETEKNELVNFVNKYQLSYRDFLVLKRDSSFGLEIEFKVNNYKNFQSIKLNKKWILVKEQFKNGLEVVSPVLSDVSKSWNGLNDVCDVLDKVGKISKDCGAHIHIGTQVLGNNSDAWLNFIKIWAVFEPIIIRFSDGEYASSRACLYDYSKYLRNNFINIYKAYENKYNFDIKDFIKDTGCINKLNAINFKNVTSVSKIEKGNTIEIRCPNGSLNPIVIQNNVNLFVKLLEACGSNRINEDLLEKMYKKTKNIIYETNGYDELNIELALGFADIVFENNLDKIYFLRQYLKNNEVYLGKFKKVKKFTK